MTRSATLSAALAALTLLPALAAKPVHAQQAPPPALVANDIAVTEIAARRPLSTAERQQVIAIDQDQFRREPAWSLQTLRREAADLKILRRMDPVRLADWRKQIIVGACFPAGKEVAPEESKAYLAIYTRANSIVAADPATRTVICERDIDAWMAASRLMATAGGVRADPRDSLVSYAHNLKFAGIVRVRAANMERNWTAYQLCWAHEPPNDCRAAMKELVGRVHKGAATGQSGGGYASGAALVLASDAYGDYPHSLDPRFAVLKPKLERMIVSNTASFMDAARRENGRIMRNGIQQSKGEDPLLGDESPALPRPPLP